MSTCYECDTEFENPNGYDICEPCARRLQAEQDERDAEDYAGEWRAEMRGGWGYEY